MTREDTRRIAHLYVEQRMSVNEVAAELGLARKTVRDHLLEAGILRKGGHPPKFSDPELRAELLRLFDDQNWPLHRLCQKFGCHISTVRRTLREEGFEDLRRHKGGTKALFTEVEARDMADLYNQGKNTREIAGMYYCSPSTVRLYLAKVGVELRHGKEAAPRQPTFLGKVTEEEREKYEWLYVVKRKTLNEMAEYLGVTRSTVARRLRMLRIPLRDRSEVNRLASERMTPEQRSERSRQGWAQMEPEAAEARRQATIEQLKRGREPIAA